MSSNKKIKNARSEIVTLEYANPITEENNNMPKSRHREPNIALNEVIYATLPESIKKEYNDKIAEESEKKDEDIRTIVLIAGGLLIGGAALYFLKDYLKGSGRSTVSEIADVLKENGADLLKDTIKK